MIALIFLLLFGAMFGAYRNKKKLSYTLVTVVVLISLLWFHHHATDLLQVLL